MMILLTKTYGISVLRDYIRGCNLIFNIMVD